MYQRKLPHHASRHHPSIRHHLPAPFYNLYIPPLSSNSPCGTYPRPSLLLHRAELTGYSKHVLNAQVAIRSPCCKKWFDCAECHAESEKHALLQTLEMVFACKKCKKCFRKDVTDWDDRYAYSGMGAWELGRC